MTTTNAHDLTASAMPGAVLVPGVGGGRQTWRPEPPLEGEWLL
jgi:hypothetical protein